MGLLAEFGGVLGRQTEQTVHCEISAHWPIQLPEVSPLFFCEPVWFVLLFFLYYFFIKHFAFVLTKKVVRVVVVVRVDRSFYSIIIFFLCGGILFHDRMPTLVSYY